MIARSFLRPLLALLLCGATSVAQAKQTGPALTDQELDQNRGGFITVDGLTIGFGAIFRTFVDGELALETTLTWTGEGAMVEHAQAGQNVVASPDVLQALSGAGIDLRAFAGAKGVTLTEDGATALLHRIEPGQLNNIIVNTGSDRDFRQETSLSLVLPGFQGTQADFVRSLTGLRIMDDVGAAAVNTGR